MNVNVQYLQKRGVAGWRYRRKIPKQFRAALSNKYEIVIPLGKTEAEALRRYPKVHAEVERQLAAAARPVAPVTHTVRTELELFQHAAKGLRSFQLDPEWSGPETENDPEDTARDVIADGILAKYPELDEWGHPIGVTGTDAAMLRVLYAGARAQRPDPTLEDAKRLYSKERVRGDKKKKLQLDRVFEYVTAALGRDRKLSSLRREDAKEVRDYMHDGRSAATVNRYLNTVRAVINHAIKEYDLAGLRNPFMGLEVEERDKAEPDRLKRRSFTEKEVEAVRARVLRMARSDLQHIWRILEGTGCRLAEVTGLRTVDIQLDAPAPHIDVEWHDERRVKNAVSRRKVPLIGDALDAAREAVKAAGEHRNVFTAYCREGGPASASAALGKHVRAIVEDPKVGPTHSLRHRMKDRLRLAGVSKADQDMILGHSSGSVGEDYGGEEARLEVARRALDKALSNRPVPL